ncbi:hypothetical protein [Clostridium sp. BJN0013]|uniref:hypothetical protein n=1 Tax=Clostridium sp. BJN0013 TaxID=3236840 RepID=UPI0034C67D3B
MKLDKKQDVYSGENNASLSGCVCSGSCYGPCSGYCGLPCTNTCTLTCTGQCLGCKYSCLSYAT